MKNIKLLLGLFTIVLVMASCAATQNTTSDDGYATDARTQQIGDRLYVQDPYYGTVILERDPFTGRYYDVTYGSRIGSLYNGYYPYRTYRHNGGYYHSYGTIGGQVQRQTPSNDTYQKDRGDARQKVLGNPKR